MGTRQRLVLVWATMLVLLAGTIGATYLPLGPFLPIASYGIAAAKAALILWFFMEVRDEGGLARLASLSAFGWLAILMTLVALDYLTRGWTGTSA